MSERNLKDQRKQEQETNVHTKKMAKKVKHVEQKKKQKSNCY